MPVCFVYTCRRLIDLSNDCRYHAETAPLVDYYRAKGVLVDYRVCYGVGDMQGLHEEIQALLGK